MSPCALCEVLPLDLPVEGTLFIAPPVHPTSVHFRAFLKSSGILFDEPASDLFRISLHAGLLSRLCEGFLALLNNLEIDSTRVLLMRSGQDLSIQEMMRMTDLRELLARVRGAWLVDLLLENRLQTWFQPIVPSENPASVYAFECLSRGISRENCIISPVEMFEIAKQAGLIFYLDRTARIAAIRNARARNISGADIFINFTPNAIYEPAFCLRTTIKAVEEAGLDPARIVFEVVESDEIRDIDHLAKLLDYYRRQGFRIALDDLGAGYTSMHLISAVRPDFVKLARELVHGIDADAYKGKITASLLELCRTLDISTIAEGVETEAEWRWLRDNGADYQQGYLFARPAPEPPEPVPPPSR